MEFAESLEHIESSLEILNEAGETVTSEQFIEYNKNQFETFKRLKMNEGYEIERNAGGEYTIKFNGKEINFKEAREASLKGDILKSMDAMGAPEEILNDTEVKQYAKEYKATWEEQTSIKSINELEKDLENGKKTTEKAGGEPTSEEDFKDKLEKNPELQEELQKKVDELKEKIKNAGEDGHKAGKWAKTKTALKIAALGVGLAGVYKLIKQHQKEINGCWLVNIATGNKCKVYSLTCDQNENERGSGDFCPTRNVSPGKTCGYDKNEACFIPGVSCIEYKSAKTCKTTLQQCKSGKCSQYCDCSVIGCPSGYILQCCNADFWTSAGDLFEKPFDFGNDILDKILKILKTVLYIFLILIFLYVLLKLVLYLFKSGKNEKNTSLVPK